MKDSDLDKEAQSRADFISNWGTTRIARELHLTSHSTVSNWKRNGFAHHAKKKLIELARQKGVDPHPDLFTPSKSLKGYHHHAPTPLSAFIKTISKAYGGHCKFSGETGIPFTSIRSLCQRTKGIMLKHVPALERAALEKGIELPEFWGEIQQKHQKWMEKKGAGLDSNIDHD